MTFPFVRSCACAAVLVLALPVAAASAPAATSAAETNPAPADGPIDPARLQAATKSVEHIFPKGTYARMMDRTLNGIMKPLLASMDKISLRDLAAMTGADEARLEAIGEAKVEEAMRILDPAYKERAAFGVPMMFKAMQGMIDEFEPVVKAGLARAYARRFDVQQLGELNTFFATPTGSAYAAESMLIYTDPEVMNTMQGMMPLMMKRMPKIVKQMEAATARFPKRRTMEELTLAERQTLNRLLGSGEDTHSEH